MSSIINNGNKPIRIVVIDSGIDTSIPELAKHVTISTGFYINDYGCIIEDKNMQSRHEHATVIALIIKHLCSSVEFISINILNERLKTNGSVLIHAFKHALRYNPSIINLSLGTTNFRYKLPLWWVVKKAERRNIIVCAATEANGHVCYPAYIKGVVAVKGDKCEKNIKIRYDNKFFHAPVHVGNIEGTKTIKRIEEAEGSSISAAYVTGYIASVMCNHKHTNCRETLNHIKSTITESKGVVI